MENERSFLGALFDLSFSEFITTRLIRLLYVLAIAAGAIVAIAFAVGGLTAQEGNIGVMGLLLAPVAFLVYVISVRIWLELVIVLFKIAENTGRLANQGER